MVRRRSVPLGHPDRTAPAMAPTPTTTPPVSSPPPPPPERPWLHHPWWTADGLALAGEGRPRIMAILNVTPDSFSDGGAAMDGGRAVERALDVMGECARAQRDRFAMVK